MRYTKKRSQCSDDVMKTRNKSNLITDVIDRSGAELAKKLLSTERPQIVNNERPKMQDVVAGEPVSFFHDNDFGAQQLGFYSRP